MFAMLRDEQHGSGELIQLYISTSILSTVSLAFYNRNLFRN